MGPLNRPGHAVSLFWDRFLQHWGPLSQCLAGFSWEGGVFPGSNCQILSDVSEPKRNKNLGFVSFVMTNRTKAAS